MRQVSAGCRFVRLLLRVLRLLVLRDLVGGGGHALVALPRGARAILAPIGLLLELELFLLLGRIFAFLLGILLAVVF